MAETTLRDRLRAVLQDPDINELEAALDAVLAALRDGTSPLTPEQLAEMSLTARSYPAITDMGELRVRTALLASFVRRLTAAYPEVDAHRCAQASRIWDLEIDLATMQTIATERSEACGKAEAERDKLRDAARATATERTMLQQEIRALTDKLAAVEGEVTTS